MDHLYIVRFDTQRNKVYKNWEYPTYCPNKKEAIAEARYQFDRCYSGYQHKAPHMFHCEAVRLEELPEYHTLRKFKVMDWRPVTWGRR